LDDSTGKTIADLNVVCRLSEHKSTSDVTLVSVQWAVITQINGHKSIGTIADLLNLKENEALTIFNELLDLGLIEIRNPIRLDDRLVPLTFFDTLQRELSKIIGPVAPFVIDDALREKDVKKGSFRLDRMPELVEFISEEIGDSTKKVRFLEVMLDIIKDYLQR